MGAIVEDVMVGRMRGAPLTQAQTRAFGAWVDAIPAAHGDTTDALAAERGRAIFQGAAGCSDCHGGAHFTSNASASVGTSVEPLQVPSLVGVSLRTPLMRSGCAATLAQRFNDETCGGGAQHGHASTLSAADVADLIAYLESL
jgi:mono/diheme cytochrome c family protein